MYTIRDACPSDNDALIELEMRCPLDLGEAELVMDRRPDFSAQMEVQEHPLVLVAEEGKLVGVVAVGGLWAWGRSLAFLRHDRRDGGTSFSRSMAVVDDERFAGVVSLTSLMPGWELAQYQNLYGGNFPRVPEEFRGRLGQLVNLEAGADTQTGP